MSDRDVGMGEMHGFRDEDVDAVLEGRTAAVPSDVVNFVGELRHAYVAEATPQPTEALAELFARGLPGSATAPSAEIPRRNRVFAPINRLGTAAKAVIAAVLLVGASSGLAAADLLPQSVDDTVSKVVPFVAADSADDDGTADQGPGDAPGTPGSDDLEDTADDSDENDDSDDNSGPGSSDSDDDDGDDDSGSENSGPGSVNSGSGSGSDDDDDDTPSSTPTTIDDDDDSTATTIDDDDDDSTVTTIDDDSGSDDSESDDSDDNSGSGSDSSGSGSDDD